MYLQDVLKEFIFDCRLRKLSERTLKGYRNNNLSLFRYLDEEFKIINLEDICCQMIQSYIEFLSDKGLMEVYINSMIKCFRAFFGYYCDEDYIQRNPMDKIKFKSSL